MSVFLALAAAAAAIIAMSLGNPSVLLEVFIPDWFAHACAYGGLMRIAMLRLSHMPLRVAAAVFLLGIAIELSQGLTPNRQVSFSDVIANGVGIAAVLFWVRLRPLLGVCGALAVSACGAMHTPENIANADRYAGYQIEQHAVIESREGLPRSPNKRQRVDAALGECRPHREFRAKPYLPKNDRTARVARGDLLRVTVEDDELLSGNVEIEADGMLHLPMLPPIAATGRTIAGLTADLGRALIAARLYQSPLPGIAIENIERAPVRVHVSGAVFEPGTVEISLRSAEQRDPLRAEASGDAAHLNGLTAALRGAAGLRPDADLRQILVKRDGQIYRADLYPALNDFAFADPMLLPGDEVHALSLGCFQPGLARPTVATRKGVKLHLSNLTIPAFSNAQSAIDDDVREVRYGTTLLQALVRMNCVGGTQLTNASRFAIHISRNPMTGETEVVERSIEALVRDGDRASYDPVLMPGDAIACYDSKVTNSRDLARSFIDIISPVPFSRGL